MQLQQSDPTWIYASYVCRILRNLVAHGMPPFLKPHDLLLQMLCIQKLAFSAPVPDAKIGRLLSRFATHDELRFDPLFAVFAQRVAKHEPGFSPDTSGPAAYLHSFVTKMGKKKTSLLLLHGCYLGLLHAILSDSSSETAWDRIVCVLIRDTLTACEHDAAVAEAMA
ncbi:MAG: hypothetical protein HN742_14075 [Lentisphaerae bacterium]|nr:hypothetical protein [Lentisphaerota bacterium]MBT5610606.1 hypothetical protein [Lentisphaerota bacterium]MBT7054485.1 hypothetical protein [Lentisphaerota bacterium]MBT7843002.1 hypothetical protein [Lentisphaerota bacterium]